MEKCSLTQESKFLDNHTLEHGLKEESMIKNEVTGILSGPEMYGLNDGLISVSKIL